MKKTGMILGGLLVSFILALPALSVNAHGEDDNHEEHGASLSADSSGIFSGFHTLHPLVVHFPIVLLIAAPFLMAGGYYRRSVTLQIAALVFAWAGAATAVVSSKWTHPETAKLSQTADEALDEHEEWAERTVVMSFIAAFLITTARFLPSSLRKARPYLNIAGFIALTAGATFVVIAGHYGAQLTYIHGIGPKGEFLKK